MASTSLKTLLLAGTVIGLTACGGGGDSTSSSDLTIGGAEVSDASALMVTEESTSSGVASGATTPTKTLVKRTDDGKVQEVKVYDQNGNVIESSEYKATTIKDLGNGYLAAGLEKDGAVMNVLLRKSDGEAIYIENDQGFPPRVEDLEGPSNPLIGGTKDYVYWRDGYTLRRIDLSDPANTTMLTVNQDDSHDVKVFLSNKNDRVIYLGDNAETGADVKRLWYGGTDYHGISGYHPFFVGLSGGFHVVPEDSPDETSNDSGDTIDPADDTIDELTIDSSGTVTSTQYGTRPQTMDTEMNAGIEAAMGRFLGINGYLVYITPVGDIYHLQNPSQSPEIVFGTSSNATKARFTDEVYRIESASDYYFVFGKDVDTGSPQVFRVDAANKTATGLIDTSTYEVKDFSVKANDTIIFHGIRISDSTRITAKHVVGTGTTLLNEEDLNGKKITELDII